MTSSSNKKIFISGSRAKRHLEDAVCDELRGIIDKQHTVLVGDAGGADKAVQMFMHREGYKNVVVYCMGDKCRNNVGDWEVCAIKAKAEGKRKDFSYFAQKDEAMSKEADYGLMLWDGTSKGTLNNVLNMRDQDKPKPSQVYFSIFDEEIDAVNDGVMRIESADHVEELVAKCGKDARVYFDKIIKFSVRVKRLRQREKQQSEPKQSVLGMPPA